MPLEIELVPASSWGANLRAALKPSQWDRLRKAVYAKAGHRCEICGGKGPKHPVECHEKWAYDDTTRTQKLVGLEALCPECHKVRHLGRQLALGEEAFQRSLKHLEKINGWSRSQSLGHFNAAMKKWQERSDFKWTLDLAWLRDAQL